VEWGALESETGDYQRFAEEFMVGGWDVLDELTEAAGKYLLLELTVHDGQRTRVAVGSP
jgi:hypothetical protein